MMEVPSTEWIEELPPGPAALRSPPVKADWWLVPGTVTHTFTHFQLELTVMAASVRLGDPKLGIWCPVDRLGEQALPTLFRKVVRHALRHA